MNNNKQIIWAKTLLNAYKYLGTLCNSIDKLVNLTAKTSFYSGGVWNEANSVYNTSQKIIKLSDRKVDYINLKVIIERVISRMTKKQAKILTLRYIKRIDSKTISKILNMSERSYYRKTLDAIDNFATILEQLGYNSEKLEIKYLGDSFINSVYAKQSYEHSRLTSENNALGSDEAFEGYMEYFKTGVVS